MKQIQFDKIGGPEVLKLAEAPVPEAVKGTVLVRNRAIGINFADTLFRQGQYAQAPVLPDTPGLEAAGVIEKVGEGVSGFSVGHARRGDWRESLQRVYGRARLAGDPDSRPRQLR